MAAENTKSFLRGRVSPRQSLNSGDLNWKPVVKINLNDLENNSPTEEYSSKEDDE